MKKLLRIIKQYLVKMGRAIAEIPFQALMMEAIEFVGDILHRALFTVLLPTRYRTLTKQQIFTIIFKSDTPAGKKFDIWLLVLITLNILVIILESLTGPAHWFQVTMRVLGWLFTLLFTFEYYLRIYCLKKPMRYVLSFYGIIDFLSIAPAYLSLFFPALSSLAVLRLMRMLRIFRIFKMQRFLDEGHFLMSAMRRSAVKILIFMLFVFLVAVVLGAVMYGIEGDSNPALSSIPKGVYWAVVTLTTVGYGDVTPVTPLGQSISVIVMLLGYSIIAVPTGIVAGETYYGHRQEQEHRQERRQEHHEVQPGSERPDHQRRNRNGNNEENNGHRMRRLREEDPGARPKAEDLM